MDSVFLLPIVLLFVFVIVKSVFFSAKKSSSMLENTDDVNQVFNQQNDFHQQMVHQQNVQNLFQDQMDNQLMNDQQSFQNSNSDSFTS